MIRMFDVADEAVVVRITVADGSDAFSRVDDEWRSQMYDIHGEAEILQHWAYNAICNGITDANRLDGWADMPRDQVRMRVSCVASQLGVDELAVPTSSDSCSALGEHHGPLIKDGDRVLCEAHWGTTSGGES